MGHSRTDVVAAALRVLDSQGLEFCAMRRVAAALEVQPSALYHHVPDKQTLLALMADEIVRGVVEHDRGDVARLCRELRQGRCGLVVGAFRGNNKRYVSVVRATQATAPRACGNRVTSYAAGHPSSRLPHQAYPNRSRGPSLELLEAWAFS